MYSLLVVMYCFSLTTRVDIGFTTYNSSKTTVVFESFVTCKNT